MTTKTSKQTIQNKNQSNFVETNVSIILYYHNFSKQKITKLNPFSYIRASKRLIDAQLNTISKSFDNYEVIVSISKDIEFLAEYINANKRYNIRIVENQISEETNECESIRLALNNVTKNKVLIMNGSILFNKNNLKSLIYDRLSTTMQENFDHGIEIGINTDGNIVQHFSFGASKAWPEILFIDKKENLNMIRSMLVNKKYKKKMFFELLNDLILLHEIHVKTNKPMIKVFNIRKST